MTAARRDPPPGYTVFEDAAGWVARNPDGVDITMGWPHRSQVVTICWDAHDAIARAVRNAEPGWFALAGPAGKPKILGGPYDTTGRARERLDRYIDDGTFRVGYGRRDDMFHFTALPEPAETQETTR